VRYDIKFKKQMSTEHRARQMADAIAWHVYTLVNKRLVAKTKRDRRVCVKILFSG